MSEDAVNITVDGVPMKARKGEMIIRVTDANDVYVPRFCYHEKLPVAANCRMCLVEVEKAPKPLPACATPVMEGMVIRTKSAKAIAAQRSVMEFLLINHPLDCPICDQGGECELQDLAIGYGRDISRYHERKRVVKDKNLGPLVSSDMTRCIHCTRCVRFGQDVAGIPELGTTGRGEHNEIGTYIEASVNHELSGNIIDLCPVGALNSKPFRYRARSWEMTQQPLVSPHDGLGTNLYGHVRRGRLMRVVPRRNDAINETWISDRDRFSYEGVYSADRLQAPMLRDGDSWKSVDWQTALEAVAQGLQQAPKGGTGFLASASSTVEELTLLSRLARGIGSGNIDHRLRQTDFPAAVTPSLGMAVADVDALQALLVVGANLRHEIPLLASRVRKAAVSGAKVSFLNPERFEYLFPVAQYWVASPAQQLAALQVLVAAARGAAAGSEGVTAEHLQVVDSLKSKERKAIWLGALAQRHPAFGALRGLAAELAALTGATLGILAEGANAAGAHLAGAVPDAGALNAGQMLTSSLHSYVLLGVEPQADSLSASAAAAMAGARFVVALTPYASDELKAVATVMLPIGSFAETSGTYVSLEGRWQSFGGAAQPVGESRPAWKVLRVLGNLLGLQGFAQSTSEEVLAEARAAADGAVPQAVPQGGGVAAIAADAAVTDVPLYQIDALVRRAPALQATRDGMQASQGVQGAA
ncbi:MAG: NADH-quinone oxidoreductase subunit NuoG [Proteobacteria bacterium]|nr:NADH-quinone oxidoreductase subunit NuoG [Pseudomonadota bacterium]